LLRREFLAAGAAGFFFPDINQSAKPPILVPERAIEGEVKNQLGRFGFARQQLPEGRILELPVSNVKRIAWTVDDGSSTEGIKDYLDFMQEHDLRMTFFITSEYPGWISNRVQVQELVDAGNLQLANHTHFHPSLKGCSNGQIAEELTRCGKFIEDTFGVQAKPYFRPPYGHIDARVESVASELGYTSPIMWRGTLGDSARQRRNSIVQLGDKYIRDGAILLDHFNARTPKPVFDELFKKLEQRKLLTVTLDDVYSRQ
jgi:peptidoglycan/xylan/chitin deacetylase (PgdA/CDA1 family)